MLASPRFQGSIGIRGLVLLYKLFIAKTYYATQKIVFLSGKSAYMKSRGHLLSVFVEFSALESATSAVEIASKNFPKVECRYGTETAQGREACDRRNKEGFSSIRKQKNDVFK